MTVSEFTCIQLQCLYYDIDYRKAKDIKELWTEDAEIQRKFDKKVSGKRRLPTSQQP